MPSRLFCLRSWSQTTALSLGLTLGPWPLGAGERPPTETHSAGRLTIEHEPPGCVPAGKYARLSACFRPEEALARGRIYFRPEDTEDWFYVDMMGTPPCLQGVLPRPKSNLGAFEYYISGMDHELVETRTLEYGVRVVSADTCDEGPLAPVVESARVIIGSAGGADPEGFLTGGGVPLALVAGLAGGATVVAAVVLGRDGDEDRTPPPTTSIRPTEDRPPSQGGSVTWVSKLDVPGARGEVLVDGAHVAFPGQGSTVHPVVVTAGTRQFEAVLLAGQGEPGLWHFDLTALDPVPGSFRVLAGQVVQLGRGKMTFWMAGESGERAVFTFDVREVGKP